jgi:hypothetical protein
MASNELESFHRWALERPEGKKGTTTDETEEGGGEDGDGGVATRAGVAVGVEVMRGATHRELILLQ